MILLLAMAMLGTVPVSTNDTVWLRAAEYPRDGLGRLDTPGVRIEITVDKLGMPVACRVVNSSGSARSDALFCTIPMQRAHFKPARDENGEPIFGVVSRNFRDRFTQGAGPTWTDLTLTPDTQ
ncbi:MAG: hypothetical protein ACRYG4_03265, partial [Janthinobacterium lividum]